MIIFSPLDGSYGYDERDGLLLLGRLSRLDSASSSTHRLGEFCWWWGKSSLSARGCVLKRFWLFFFGAALVFIPCLSDQMMDEHSIYQHDERNVIFFTVVTCGFTFDFSFCLRSSIVVVVFFSFLNLFLLFNWRLIPSSFTTMLQRASRYGRVCRLDLCWICLNQQLTVRLYLIARKEPTILSITKKMRF